MNTRRLTSLLIVFGRFALKSAVLILFSTWLVALLIGSIPNFDTGDPLTRLAPLGERLAGANTDFFTWLGGVLRFDLGYSDYYYGDRVAKYLFGNFMITLLLTVGTLAFSGVAGMTLGVAAATKEEWRIQHESGLWGRTLGRALRFMLYSVNAVPTYIAAILLLLLSSGISSWVMAAVSLMLGSGILMDFTQMSYHLMRAEYTQPYVIHALALGYRTRGTLPVPGRVSWHALRSTLARLIPSVGSKIPFILGNVIVVEIVLELPGLSEPLLGGVLHRDLPLVLAVILFTTLLVQAVSLAMDLLDFLVHPSKKFVL